MGGGAGGGCVAAVLDRVSLRSRGAAGVVCLERGFRAAARILRRFESLRERRGGLGFASLGPSGSLPGGTLSRRRSGITTFPNRALTPACFPGLLPLTPVVLSCCAFRASAHARQPWPSALRDGVGKSTTGLSRLNHTAHMLAIYASRPTLRTARARHASGWADPLAARAHPARLQMRFHHSLFTA